MARGTRRDESGNLLERPPAMLKKSGDAERIRQIFVLLLVATSLLAGAWVYPT